MGVRKLKAYKHIPELRVLRKPETEKEPILGFIVLIFLTVFLAVIFFQTEESKKESEF